MQNRDIIVIGASAGGIEALRNLVAALPGNLPGSLLIAMHTAADSPGVLDVILRRAARLPAHFARDNMRIESGRVYIAPPDQHMLVEPGRIRLSRGPKENRFRPAIDPLFRSAAQVYGPRVVGVILTGGLDDGTAGLWAIKQLGGATVVQDPSDAYVPSMPLSAIRHVRVDYQLPLAKIPALLVRLTSVPAEVEGVYEMPENLDLEVRIAKQDPAIDLDVREIWEPSSYTCPECHGVLLKLEEGGRVRFRCHTGHAFSSDSLLADLTETVEASLWTTIRSIEESVMLMRHIAQHLIDDGQEDHAIDFLKKADEAQDRAELVRKAVVEHEELNKERVMEEAEV